MEYNFDNIDNLIARVLSGEADEAEQKELQVWVAASPENAAYLETSRQIFTRMDSLKTLHRVDTKKAWDKLNQRLESESGAKVIPMGRRSAFRAAASLLLIASLTVVLVLVFRSSPEPPLVLASASSSVTKDLPDGSKVVLNKNSEITYQANKFGSREVKLKGEAYFDVVHDDAKPFVISVGGIVIKDIGTAFNVKALEGSDTIEVYVESGEVQFYYRNNENSGLNLKQGEKAIYKRSTGGFHKFVPDINENISSYKSKIFHFNAAMLRDVVRQINTVYGSDIQLSNDMLGQCRLSVDFNQEDLELIITIISETLDLQVERSGNTVLLKGNACTEHE